MGCEQLQSLVFGVLGPEPCAVVAERLLGPETFTFSHREGDEDQTAEPNDALDFSERLGQAVFRQVVQGVTRPHTVHRSVREEQLVGAHVTGVEGGAQATGFSEISAGDVDADVAEAAIRQALAFRTVATADFQNPATTWQQVLERVHLGKPELRPTLPHGGVLVVVLDRDALVLAEVNHGVLLSGFLGSGDGECHDRELALTHDTRQSVRSLGVAHEKFRRCARKSDVRGLQERIAACHEELVQLLRVGPLQDEVENSGAKTEIRRLDVGGDRVQRRRKRTVHLALHRFDGVLQDCQVQIADGVRHVRDEPLVHALFGLSGQLDIVDDDDDGVAHQIGVHVMLTLAVDLHAFCQADHGIRVRSHAGADHVHRHCRLQALVDSVDVQRAAESVGDSLGGGRQVLV